MPVSRFARIVVLACLTLALVPVAASAAAPRMWVGFQDDPNFRWNDARQSVLDDALEAHATVIRTTVYWYKAAPSRPATASDPSSSSTASTPSSKSSASKPAAARSLWSAMELLLNRNIAKEPTRWRFVDEQHLRDHDRSVPEKGVQSIFG